MKPTIRTLAIVLAALAAIAVPALQALAPFGLSAAEFSYQGDSTLKVAGYAFSIWSVLYVGMMAFAIFQAMPSTSESPVLRTFGWPAAFAMAGCALWLVAAALNWQWGSVAVISLSAFALIRALLSAPKAASRAERWLIIIPMSLLAGWLTVASVVNILSVLTMQGIIGAGTASAAALVGIVTAVLIASLVALRSGRASYVLPIAWGLVAVHVAENARKPEVGYAALGTAAALLVLVALFGWSRARRARIEHELLLGE